MRRMTCRRILGPLVAAAVAAAHAAEPESLTYILRPDPAAGRIRIELTWRTAGREDSPLGFTPRWGNAGDIEPLLGDVQFDGAIVAGRERGAWTLHHRREAAIRVTYVVEPPGPTLTWARSHVPVVTADYFHGIGHTLLLTPLPGRGLPATYEVLLRWDVPRDWTALCSWAVGRAVGDRLRPDDLRHSAYVAGRLHTRDRNVPGVGPLTVAVPARLAFPTADFVELAAGLIRDQCRFMQESAFPPFTVLVVPVEEPLPRGTTSLSGTGLYQSLVLFVPPETRLGDSLEHLFAHELLHYWNGGVLAAEEPDALVYWFIEGFTDYFALRILFESGRWNAATYAKWLNRHLRAYHTNPARNATNAEIQARFWQDRDTVGEVPYQRGLLLGLRWQAVARQRGIEDGVGRLFRHLLAKARAGDFRLNNDRIRAAGQTVLGEWFTAEFDRYVVAAETVQVPPDALAPALTGAVRKVYEFQLGFDREASLATQRVIGLVGGSAAAKAGLREGDALVGWDIHGEADKEIRLQVRRGDKLHTIRYFPRGAAVEILQFAPSASPS